MGIIMVYKPTYNWGAPSCTGWWCTYPSEKYYVVSWGDDYSQLNGNIKAMFQTTNQIIVLLKWP